MARSNNNNNNKSTNKNGKGSKPNSNRRGKGGKPKSSPNKRNTNTVYHKEGKWDVREQPEANSDSPRINLDNARESKVAEEIAAEMKSGKFNDISWYVRNSELARAASTIPMIPILGMKNGPFSPVPGIMRIGWEPNYGPTGDGTRYIQVSGATELVSKAADALNQASDANFSFQVHAIGRNPSYNSSDLTILTYAGIQVFCIIRAMKRAYGVCKSYYEHTRYTPAVVLQAMGFEPTSLEDHLADVWYDLNLIIEKSKQVWIPNDMPILDRWMQLNSDFYADAPNNYAQLYIPVQAHYYNYREVQTRNGGSLQQCTLADGSEFNPFANSYTWQQWVYVAKRMIQNLLDAEDRGLIYGDMFNAYGTTRLYAEPSVGNDYVTGALYSQEMLMQIENLTVNTCAPTGLVQYENILWPTYNEQTYVNKTADYIGYDSGVLNFHDDVNLGYEFFIEATRLQTLGAIATKVQKTISPSAEAVDLATNWMFAWIPAAAGSEVVIGLKCALDPELKGGWTVFNTQLTQSNPTRSYGFVDGYALAFDWSPFSYVQSYTDYSVKVVAPTEENVIAASTIGKIPVSAHGDYDYYGNISWQELRKIHEMCMFSLVGMPYVV